MITYLVTKYISIEIIFIYQMEKLKTLLHNSYRIRQIVDNVCQFCFSISFSVYLKGS